MPLPTYRVTGGTRGSSLVKVLAFDELLIEAGLDAGSWFFCGLNHWLKGPLYFEPNWRPNSADEQIFFKDTLIHDNKIVLADSKIVGFYDNKVPKLQRLDYIGLFQIKDVEFHGGFRFRIEKRIANLSRQKA